MKKFDRGAIAVAQKYKDACQVILICGAAHALATSRKEGWPMKLFIQDTPRQVRHALREYHVSYVLPQYYPTPVR